MLQHALDHHVNHVINIVERFGLRRSPRRCPLLFKERAISMPPGRISIEILVRLNDDPEVVRLHVGYYDFRLVSLSV